jgi:hypothetical protein
MVIGKNVNLGGLGLFSRGRATSRDSGRLEAFGVTEEKVGVEKK